MRTTAVCTAAALLVDGLVVSGAAPASASDRYRFVVTEHGSMANLDLGPEGLSPGDRFTYTSTVRNPAGAKVGSGSADCVLLSGATEQDALYHCTGIYRIGRTDLSVTGLFGDGATKGSWMITGGTGKWAGAHGDMQYTSVPADSYRLVFRFTT